MTTIGQTVMAGDGTGTTYYSPWFPRGGNQGNFVCDLIATNKMSSFNIQVQTKNSEDSDKDRVNVGSPATITLTKGEQTEFKRGAVLSDTANIGFKELVRFEYVLVAETSSVGTVHFRMQNVSWLSN